MAVFGIEVARVLSERSLEISFANALSTVSSTGANPQELDLEAALQAQLMSYSGLEELESVATSIKIPDAALAGHDQLPRNSISSNTGDWLTGQAQRCGCARKPRYPEYRGSAYISETCSEG